MTAFARVLVVGASQEMRHLARAAFVDVLRPGDLVVANDAATLPASLHGTHVASGKPIEIRLAARRTLSPDVTDFAAIVFGAGDFHTRTEDRPPPPSLAVHDRLALGPLSATVTGLLGHPRLVALHFRGSADDIWAGIARHGRPIQYAHVATPLLLWDVWTPIASPPVAFEPPSAGFALDWRTIAAMRSRGIGFATITHAAGISSTGDPELDRRLPFDEPYDIPASTARAITTTRARGGRIVAIGTTVVRALEHAGPRRTDHEDTTTRRMDHEDTTARSQRTGSSVQVLALRRNASGLALGSASSTRFSPVSTSEGRVTTSCSAHLPMTARSRRQTTRWRHTDTGRTNSVTRFW